MAFGIHQLEDRDWVFKQDVTIQGDFTFGNAATDTLTVTGDYTQTYAGTSDGFIVSGTGAQTAGKDLARFTTVGSLSSTSNVVAIEQGTGAGVAGSYGLYINCTGTNVEALKVDAGNAVFDEDVTVAGTLAASAAATVGTTLGVTGVSTLTGGADVAATLLTSTTTATSGAGAVAITGTIHEITTTGTGDALTLADGAEGQHLFVVYVAEGAGGDTGVLTPTNLAGANTTITFTDLGDGAHLLFTAGAWYFVGGEAVVA
jgi:hypothetical protein